MKHNVSRTRRLGAVAAALLLGALPVVAQDPAVEAGFEDDVTIRGRTGTRNDPDFEVQGYTAFGTNFAGATFVTSGVGHVYIQRSLEVGSNLYARGAVVFPDGSQQATAYNTNRAVMLASGECDTNRLDILFSSAYLVSTIRVWQAAAAGQAVSVFLNGSSVTTFPFTTVSATVPLAVNLSAFDRLGILCTNLSSTVLFAFEGRAR
jgi:hypothetical protein